MQREKNRQRGRKAEIKDRKNNGQEDRQRVCERDRDREEEK